MKNSTLERRFPSRALPASRPVRGARWLWRAVALASGLIAAYALAYLVLGERVYPEELADSFRARPWGIYTHALFATVGLALGPWQFRRGLTARRPGRHRLLGKVYLLCALMVGVTGVYMAAYAYGGLPTSLGFGAMGVALLAATGLAYARIRAGDAAAHREWMVRGFAVMFAGVTFRLWVPALMAAHGGDFEPAYRLASWLCWVLNLLAAEWYVRSTRARASAAAVRPAVQ